MVTVIVPFAITGLLVLAALAFLLLLAVDCLLYLQGKDFSYAVIARGLECYLTRDTEAKEPET